MKALLSDSLWERVSEHAAGHRRIRAANAYVTATHLDFRRGDLLVCDASDPAIKGNLTSASLLRSFVDQGAEVYSYQGLHSKVAVIDDRALVGSANMSENAGVTTCEAALFTDDPQVVALALGFVVKVKQEAEKVDDGFLTRIAALPVARSGGWRRTSEKKIEVGDSRVWIISTVPLGDNLPRREAELVEAGTKEAMKRVQNKGYEVEPVRWLGKSRFRSLAKPGDLVISVLTEKRGKRTSIEVYRHAPIVYRQDAGKWTRFYLEVPKQQVRYSWKDIEADFKGLGVTASPRTRLAS